MTLEHSELIALTRKENGSLWICSLTEKARIYFKCSSGAIYLSSVSARHILEKHKDISTFDLLLLPIAIDQGELYEDPADPRFVSVIYELGKDRAFYVPMKITASGHELWVSSMHRQTARQILQKRKKLRPVQK